MKAKFKVGDLVTHVLDPVNPYDERCVLRITKVEHQYADPGDEWDEDAILYYAKSFCVEDYDHKFYCFEDAIAPYVPENVTCGDCGEHEMSVIEHQVRRQFAA